jgi:hypothetical protein
MKHETPESQTQKRSGLALVLGIVLLVLLAAWQNRALTETRRAGLPEAPAYAAQVPPFLTFITVGLGGFRGIAAEALWSRADRMQEEGRFLELVQLTEWITRLDPHATEAWTYNAWNMAYNVSAVLRRPEDRLRWVEHGISLLRDQGIPANPNSARLCRELAWFYQHKIGSSDDAAHLTYKLALVDAMAPCLIADGSLSDTPENRARLTAGRLDPDRMRRLEKRFGPLDWRLAMSHAIYWGSVGMEHATGYERLACRRAVYQPLLQSVLAGRFDGNPAQRTYHASPNRALILPGLSFMRETFSEHPTPGVRMSYGFFLIQAIRQAHEAGQAAQVADWYRELLRVGKGVIQPIPLDALLRGEMPELVQ